MKTIDLVGTHRRDEKVIYKEPAHTGTQTRGVILRHDSNVGDQVPTILGLTLPPLVFIASEHARDHSEQFILGIISAPAIVTTTTTTTSAVTTTTTLATPCRPAATVASVDSEVLLTSVELQPHFQRQPLRPPPHPALRGAARALAV